jgi:hypothetical protein
MIKIRLEKNRKTGKYLLIDEETNLIIASESNINRAVHRKELIEKNHDLLEV